MSSSSTCEKIDERDKFVDALHGQLVMLMIGLVGIVGLYLAQIIEKPITIAASL